ncbi:hypothetical protein [Natronococcus jeotgali]|uniref:Uncharacterized protein n=1 Tax=Natronococcus jeotgali DSM 18795 TaxID=1227498 RepID=L9X524_9EURY|nr:hypothetical protein [Natronococcus jeotgali]ELY55693.1 hypothetical protein C492_15501 [Natronococcus jeotgali DSM 18795]
MAPAIAHFLLGASLALLVATPIALRFRLPAWVPLWLVAVGGIWGLVPDVHHVAPLSESQLYAFHNTQWADLFAFHYTLDAPAVRARHDASVFWSIALFLVASALFTIAGVANARTAVGETPAPHLLALATASIPGLLFVAATVGIPF